MTPQAARIGFTLVEVMVVVVVIGILSTICALSFPRAVEQARADLAAAHLRNIQLAQRFHALDRGTYAATVAELHDAGLLGDEVLGPEAPAAMLAARSPSFLYTIDPDDRLMIHATRSAGSPGADKGTLTIDRSGLVRGELRAPGAGPGAPTVRPARIFTHLDP